MSAKELTHISLQVKGMNCSNCALGIERYLKKEGLDEVNINFAHGEVVFKQDKKKKIENIIEGIENLGFEVFQDEDEIEEETGLSILEKRFYFSLIFTVPLLLHMFMSWHVLHNHWVQLALCVPVFIIGMIHFGRSGYKSLEAGYPNMDVLISIGAISAFGYSLYGSLTGAGPDFLFYETAASVITLVLLGNLLEERSVKKTTSAIQDLKQFQVKEAHRIQMEDGHEYVEKVDLSEIRIGDILQVNTGDRIPLDGVILAGSASLDESMVSGESLPLIKTHNEEVIGGTLLLEGNIQMRVNKLGKDSTLAKIIELVKGAQKDKPQIQQLADKISAVFVPVVLCISLLTFGLSFFVFGLGLKAAIIHSIAVLVISCPCAMGLATPTAVIVGIGRASKQGILIKGGRSLEKFSKIKRIVFDKTGTLTDGRFKIADIACAAEEKEEVKKVIRSIELYSSHPIAKSLQEELKDAGLKSMRKVEEEKGIGMFAEDQAGNQYKLGSSRILEGREAKPHTLYLLKNDEIWAGIDLQDRLRAGAKEMVQFFKKEGIQTVLLSGDRAAACHQIAEELGIDEVYAEQLPKDKLDKITVFSEDQATAMLGDGVNDAPALSRAFIGISLAKATEVAMQSSEIVLAAGNLTSLIDLYKISKETVLTIKQNLFWAFFYNVLAIPMAAIGMLKPIIAAAAMAFSDVIVIGNSLRLRFKKIA